MKNKKLLVALIAFVAVIALVVGIWFATRPAAPAEEPAGDTLKFTVIVVHADGEEKTFNYETEGGNLGPVLVEKGLLGAADGGLYTTVDGVTADWNVDQSWWAFYIGEEMAAYGMDDAVIHDGDVFKLVYTK